MELFLAVVVTFVYNVYADMYFHNPRGSNNRLDEEGRNRNNANRMFDSQNNDRGGYNVGSLYYYESSQLPIEWTNQHSCGGPNNHCEIILQYMCGSNVRDGVTTSTIPQNPLECQGYDCNTDTRYGMNEDYFYYMRCKTRERNQGLFTADQKLKGDAAKYTRQNPGGTRRAYECPEERDYYPYWHPSPWKDIAILTNDASRCPYYEAESENVKGRGECMIPNRVLLLEGDNHNLRVPNTKEECEQFVYPENDPDGVKGVWKESPSHGIPAPLCRENEYSRDNHLGNGAGGNPNLFNWTIPDINHERCVMRIRYNISTEDYTSWGNITAAQNKQRNKQAANIDVYSNYDFKNAQEAADRGYEFKNNPQVELFPDVNLFKLQLAINTAQYGRTFQDRSHTFAVRRRGENLEDAKIHNLNVRGKRGNIVQVYPAVEYDFVPNTLRMQPNDFVHFQWTGSNSNPQNNDGQGRKGTDRSNVVLQGAKRYAEGSSSEWYGKEQIMGHWGRSYPASLRNTSLLGLSQSDMMNLALLTNIQFRGEMSELDDAGTYFDLGPRKITSTGTYHYMCTRNNNFSNRSQKGRILVTDYVVHDVVIGWNGGDVTLPDGEVRVVVEQGAFKELQQLRFEKVDPEEAMSSIEGQPPGDKYHSDLLTIHPQERLAPFTVEMKVEKGGKLEITEIYHNEGGDSTEWNKIEAVDFGNGWATFQTDMGGSYVAVASPNAGLIAGVVIVVLLVVAAIVIIPIIYFKRNPDRMSQLTRGFQAKI